ncbi:MAG: hypothetical protein KDD47_00375, partial [Acidobacteria bacterium]|nr:hypothetical protein [Acidobacteriota bacterium]
MKRFAIRLHPLVLVFLSAVPATTPASHAQDCFHGQCVYSECHTPAFGAPSQLWNELEATDGGSQLPANRDNSDFDQVGDF